MGTLLQPTNNLNTDPSVLGPQALDLTRQGGLQSVIGTGLSGLSQTAAYMYQSRVASNNALSMTRNAQAALAAGSYAEGVKRIQTGETKGAVRAGQAANNVDVNVGSTWATQGGVEKVGEADALAIRYNAAREAYNFATEAASERAKSGLARMGAISAFAGGVGNTYASYISSSSALLNKALQLKQYGAIG